MKTKAEPIPDLPISLDYNQLREQIVNISVQLKGSNMPNVAEMQTKLEEIASRRKTVEDKLRDSLALLDSKIEELEKKNAD